MSNVEKWEKRIKYRRISTWAIVILSAILIIIILLTVYGMHVGNFVISVPTGQQGLSLSETESFASPTTRLDAPGLMDQREATKEWIDFEHLYTLDGSNNDKGRRYICYGFYVRNESPDAVNYEYSLEMFEVTRRVDSALRVLIKHHDTELIFAKPQEVPPYEGVPENHPYVTEPFVSDTVIAARTFLNFQPGEIRKFTVIMWLEGEDAQCTNDIKGGSLKLDFNIRIIM